MIHDIPIPEISQAFTITNIRKILEWDYERLKDATPEDQRADIEHRAEKIRCAIEKIRVLKAVNIEPRAK